METDRRTSGVKVDLGPTYTVQIAVDDGIQREATVTVPLTPFVVDEDYSYSCNTGPSYWAGDAEKQCSSMHWFLRGVRGGAGGSN